MPSKEEENPGLTAYFSKSTHPTEMGTPVLKEKQGPDIGPTGHRDVLVNKYLTDRGRIGGILRRLKHP